MNNAPFASIVLAAGKGTRMKSARPKVLHEIAGRSMLAHVMQCLEDAGASQVVVVTSPEQDDVRAEAARIRRTAVCAVQESQRGTADAVKAGRDHLSPDPQPVVVLCADTPLVRPQTIVELIGSARHGPALAVLGFHAADPTGYGRLLLDGSGLLEAIREDADASETERAIDLCNSGVIAFGSGAMLELLDGIDNDNAKGEYYLTDVVEIANRNGSKTAVVECSETEVLGVNSRAQLARAEALMQERLRRRAMDAGVTLIAPETVYLSADTQIAEDVVIEPHVFIGRGVAIAAGAVIRAFSHIEETEIGRTASVGPFARLRPGARLGAGARVGNFVEIKNAEIEDGAKVNHLTYVGDARVGQGANIGAGTITCNYDGAAKHFTDIGAGAFIGSNSSLVAPVRIGEGAYIGSGSVITRNVDPGALAVGRARQMQISGWAERKRSEPAEKSDSVDAGGKKTASGG